MYTYYIYHPDLKTPYKLKYDPVGWDTVAKSIVRDTDWHGVMFKYTPKLKFVKDGRALVQYFYERYGIECELTLYIDKYNPVSKRNERDYEGRFNLTSYNISTLYVECNIEQTGFTQKVKNRQDVKVDLTRLLTQDEKPIQPNTSEMVDVELHSKEILQQFVVEDLNTTIPMPFEDSETFYILMEMSEPQLDEIEERFDYPDQYSKTAPTELSKYQFKVKTAGVYTWEEITLTGQLSNTPRNIDCKLRVVYGKPGSYTTQQIGPDTTWHSFDNHTLTGSFSANLQVDDEVYFYFRAQYVGPSELEFGVSWGFSLTYKLKALTTVPATQAKVFLKHETIARVIESITDEADSFRSNYYGRTDSEPTSYMNDGAGSLRGILSGKMLRGFPVTENSVTVSLDEILQTCRAIDGVGIGIVREGFKERVVLEPLSFFYHKNRIAQFDYVRGIEKEVATEYIYNELQAGYEKALNEDLNNLDEFNAKRNFPLPITQIKRKLMLTSPIIGGGYTIEFVRRDKYVTGSNKDNERDNDNFIIQFRRSDGSFVTDRDQDFAELNNLISPSTVYNAKISVMRNIMRNGSFIRSGLYHQDDKEIKLSTGEGNIRFTSRLNTETSIVQENRIAINQLGQALWIPEFYKFKFKPSRAQAAAIEADPYGIIEFSETNKNRMKGYLIEQEPDAKSGLNNYKLLRANV